MSGLLDKAMKIAANALEGIQDSKGEPYFEHSVRVMNHMDTDNERIAAVLHDVLEDSEMTIGELEDAGFDRDVLVTVDQLTKKSDMTYDEYIEDISCNPMAVKIKMAELDDNQDVFRVNKMSFKTYSLKERVERAKKMLRHEM